MSSVEWTAHPAKERPRDVALVLCVFCLTMAATLIAFQSLFLTGLAAVILTLGISSFLLPTTYSLSEWGVEAKGMVRKRARGWSELRRYEIGKEAVLVSPFAKKTRLDRYRGMVLLLGNADRDQVVRMLELNLGPTENASGADDDEEE